jgi:hypothetical protein
MCSWAPEGFDAQAVVTNNPDGEGATEDDLDAVLNGTICSHLVVVL